MKIFTFSGDGAGYTCNSYLVLGSWNTLLDVNTLIDPGRDPALLAWIRDANTGVGKRQVEQVVVTHSHYDHVEMLGAVCEAYAPVVRSFSPLGARETHREAEDHAPRPDSRLRHGECLRMGDRTFEVIHVTAHSNDSVCLFCAEEGVLFAGDTPLLLRSPATYDDRFIETLARLAERDVRAIYFGHGPPLLSQCRETLAASVAAVRGGSDHGHP